MKKYITIISVLAAGLVAFTACKKDKEIVGTNDTEGFFINRTELAPFYLKLIEDCRKISS